MLNRANTKEQLIHIQKKFYEESPIDNGWGEKSKTFFWSNNGYLAMHYAKMISIIIRDSNKKINIIELGAGQGKFSFLLLKSLYKILSDEDQLKIHYIMTDISQERIKFWAKHPKIQDYIQKGIIDFGCFDIYEDKDFLLESGVSFQSVISKNNNILISNYTLSDIVSDPFTVEKHQLFECIFQLDKNIGSISKEEHLKILKELKITFKKKQINPNYYNDSRFNTILQTYAQMFEQSAFEIPSALIKIFNFMNLLSHDFYWFITDEAYINAKIFENRKPQVNKIPSGLLSNQVNLDALNRYIKEDNFHILSKPVTNEWFDTYVLISKDSKNNQQIESLVNNFNTDDFIKLYNSIAKLDEIQTNMLFGLIKLSNYDTQIVKIFRKKLLKISLDGNRYEKEQLIYFMKQSWENYFEINEKFDSAYYFGRIFKRLDHIDEAILCFNYSVQKYGEYANAFYYLGICSQKINQHKEAIKYFEKTIELKPGDEKSQQNLNKSLESLNG